MTVEDGMQSTERTKEWISLSDDGDALGLMVTSKDGDRFYLSLEEAISACRSADRAKEFSRQLIDIFERLSCWIGERSDSIDRAYLSISDEGLDFTVVLTSMEFEQSIDESLVDLDIAIAQDPSFDNLRLDVMSLPYCSEEAAGRQLPAGRGL